MTKRKSLSYLIEAELEKATVLLAAKAITDKLQQIAEQLAKMDANDVMPLGDSMRDLFGSEQSASFESAVSEKLRNLTEQVRTTKNEIADQIDALESGEPMNDLNTMGDDDMFGGDDDAAAAEAPEAGADDEFAMGGGQGDDDQSTDMGDDLDGAFDMGGAAGRVQKESAAPKKKGLEQFQFKAKGEKAKGKDKDCKKSKDKDCKLDESSADIRLVREFSALLARGKSAGSAAHLLAESYAIDVRTVVDIITSVKKG